jgi:DNA-binding MarR family transcriptional regulator
VVIENESPHISYYDIKSNGIVGTFARPFASIGVTGGNMPRSRITKSQYELLAELRRALRRFQLFSREAARASGLTAQQHQALLAIKGFPGRDYLSIGELAERLQVRHHSAVGLVDRLARQGLARRAPSEADRRRVEVRLTARGEAKIERLSAAHIRELRQLGPGLRSLLGSMAQE